MVSFSDAITAFVNLKDILLSNLAFSSLDLSSALIQNLASLGYNQMTFIQAQSLPLMLKGDDVIGQAKTGSGKTVAFGLALLANLKPSTFQVQSLVLCPTRELADQVAQEIRKLARLIPNIKVLTLCGGAPFGPQIGSLEHGAHIVVGTPGRVDEHLRKGHLQLDKVNTFVLDEADRMLEMGFQDEIEAVLAKLPSVRQNLLFSATFSAPIKTIADNMMSNPVFINVKAQEEMATIEQHFYHVKTSAEKINAIKRLLLKYQPKSCVIFCNTKRFTQQVSDELHLADFSVTSLHGDLEQRERDKAIVRFANKSISVLVATDVAARGLDIEMLDAVINAELSFEPQVHVHRIGRTGRAGHHGVAFSLFDDKDAQRLVQIEDYMGMSVIQEALPSAQYLDEVVYYPQMVTLWIDGGKKNKLRPGDILGALTGQNGIDAQWVGKINIFDFHAYVAVHHTKAKQALSILQQGKLKGRKFRVNRMRA